ncbi:MAG: hypothetical protein EOP05_02955 [Proteobacteria bacterium]|nr:MAG: hypothetical protein EOP05_02955 [Pseudomonadota bacterium]
MNEQDRRSEIVSEVIEDQRYSLTRWIDYFLSEDSAQYPMWAKYWTINGLTKLSKFDPTKSSFGNRATGTVAPFPELNREALGLVLDNLIKNVNGLPSTEVRDEQLTKLLEGANFGKLYGHALELAGFGANKQFPSNDGRWRRFERGSNHLSLVASLEERNTGWCTATEGTAKTQLEGGDFYVYFSYDSKGIAAVPRIAIRMSGENIGEIRGVGNDQNLDLQISSTSILSDKIKTFGPKGESYLKRESHMRLLSALETKTKLQLPLTKSELEFLYERNEKIEGFGQTDDGRALEIIKKRDVRADWTVMLDGRFSPAEVSITESEALSGAFKVHVGNLYLRNKQFPDGTRFPELMFGQLDFFELQNANGLVLPRELHGSLHIYKLRDLKTLHLPEVVKGDLRIHDAVSAGVKLPLRVDGNLVLDIRNAEGLLLPKYVGGAVRLVNLTSARGLFMPEGSVDYSGPADIEQRTSR